MNFTLQQTHFLSFIINGVTGGVTIKDFYRKVGYHFISIYEELCSVAKFLNSIFQLFFQSCNNLVTLLIKDPFSQKSRSKMKEKGKITAYTVFDNHQKCLTYFHSKNLGKFHPFYHCFLCNKIRLYE